MYALLMLLLAAPADTAPTDVAATYRSEKTLPQLQECLTTRLSASGDVVAVQAEGYITLIYKDGTHPPTVIDLAPPQIIVKTRQPKDARKSIQSCL